MKRATKAKNVNRTTEECRLHIRIDQHEWLKQHAIDTMSDKSKVVQRLLDREMGEYKSELHRYMEYLEETGGAAALVKSLRGFFKA